jgi:hypothetical protein
MVELPESRDSRRMLVLDSNQAGELASSETRVPNTLLWRLHTDTDGWFLRAKEGCSNAT